MSHIRPRKHRGRLSKQEREMVLDLLYQEALRMAHGHVPIAEMDRQLRGLRRELVQAVRAGIQFVAGDAPAQVESASPEIAERQEK